MRASLVALALAGCSTATSVDVTVLLGSDVAARASQVASLRLQVAGDRVPFDRKIDVTRRFGSGKETLEYLPGVSRGTLTFTITLADAAAGTLGSGTASANVVAGSAVPITVVVGTNSADGGQDLPPPDLATPCSLIQVSTLAGNGAAGYVDGPGASARFSMADGIIADPAGTLYVAEALHIRQVLADGTTSTFSPGNYLTARRVARRPGNADFYVVDTTNDTLFYVAGAGGNGSTVFLLGGITAVGSGGLTSVVADVQTCDISSINPANMPVRFSGAACGFLDGPQNLAQYSTISDLVYDATGVLYVADQGNFRIRKVAADGSATTLAGSVQGHVDGTGAAAQFQSPTGIAIDDAQRLVYVADGTTIRVISASGDVRTVVGSTAGIVDGIGCTARFAALKGIAFFAGALYVVDVERVRKIVLP